MNSRFIKRKQLQLRQIFNTIAKWTCPPLYRHRMKNQAKARFNEVHNGINKLGSGPYVLGLMLVERNLKNAGYDIETDQPYQEVLGLEGGRAEFEKLQAPKPQK